MEQVESSINRQGSISQFSFKISYSIFEICFHTSFYITIIPPNSRRGKRDVEDEMSYQRKDGFKRRLNSDNQKDSKIDRRNASSNINAANILPGASTLEDINMYIHAAKKEKIEQLRKKSSFNR